ncbi:MAG: hypothetical protein E7478_04970 [Ruminococcaceae bacterium]|nr:hypothetical protein [Oscillospiraceae bacterium]
MVNLRKKPRVSLVKPNASSGDATGFELDDEKKILRRGTFKCAHPYERVFVFTADILCAVNTAYWFIMTRLYKPFEDPDLFEAKWSLFLLFFLVGLIVRSVIVAIATIGRECSYRAEQKEFVVEGPARRREIFYYSDVYAVHREPLTLYGVKRGYLVTIETGVREVQYRYIYSDKKLMTDFEDTPFYFLAVNSGIMEYSDEPSGITFEDVAAMMVQRGVRQLEEEKQQQYRGFDD